MQGTNRLTSRRASNDERRRRRSSGEAIERGVAIAAIALLVAGVLLVLIIAVDTDWVQALATAAAVFFAAAVLGSLGGFLFGLPRDAPAPTETTPTTPVLRFVFNSNLLKVSDWLTTIIVGLTLVNLRSIGPAISDLGDALSAPLGGPPYGATFGVSIAIFGFVGSAILMYLWTTVRLRQHLERSEMELNAELRNSGASGLVVDFVRGQAKEDEVRTALASVSDDALLTIKARLPEVEDPEMKQRRDRVVSIIDERTQPPTS